MKNDIVWTPQQSNAISSKSDQILVSAAAGSGKTSVMIERIVSLIRQGIPLGRMIVCTFTRASAADMRSKLYKRLASFSDPFCEQQIEFLPQAEISTIDSWCQRLVKTYFYEAGIDPNFEIIEPFDANTLLMDSIKAVVNNYLSDTGSPSEFFEIYEILSSNRKDTRLKEIIERLYDFAVVQPDVELWLENCLNELNGHERHIRYLTEQYLPQIKDFQKRAAVLLDDAIFAGFTKRIEDIQALYDCIKNRTLPVRHYAVKMDEAIFEQINEEFVALKAQYKSVAEKYIEAIESEDCIKAYPHSKIIVDMTLKAHKLFLEEKKRRAVLDYGDLEHGALKILNKPALIDEIKKRYDYIFVDEYQDTNPLQEEIFKRLEANKFFVGDVKQSIYSFRMCDPRIFADKCENPTGEVIELNKNYRSANSILDFCNKVFSDIMTKNFGSVEYKDTARFVSSKSDILFPTVECFIAKGKVQIEPPKKGVYSVLNHAQSESAMQENAEINLIVSYILSICGKTFIENGEEKIIRASDIVILLRTINTKFAANLTKTLRQAAFSVFIDNKIPADSNHAVRLLISYLYLIDNAHDDIALVSAMSSIFGGFTDDELSSIRASHPKGSFYDAVCDLASTDFPLGQRLESFLERLNRYRRLSKGKTASELAGIIVAETDYFMFAHGLGSAKELAEFLDILSKSKSNSSLTATVRSLRSRMPALSPSCASDAINIRTIHSSKGLEFPVVIFANLSAKFNSEDLRDCMFMDSKLGFALKYWDYKNKTSCTTSLMLRLKNLKWKSLLEEEMRLMYVALTRPIYKLAMFGSIEQTEGFDSKCAIDAKSYMEWLYPFVLDYAKIVDIKDCNVQLKPPHKHISYKKPDKYLVEKIKEYTDFTYKGDNLPTKLTVSETLKNDLENEYIEFAEFSQIESESQKGALVGSAYHKLLEKIDFSLADFDAALSQLMPDYNELCQMVSIVELKKAYDFFSHRLNGKKYYREVPFVQKVLSSEIDVKGEGEVMIQGIIDLIVRQGSYFEIIDYKSGVITEDRLKKYSKQLKIYQNACEKILNIKVEKKYVYSLKEAKLYEI